jgi:hypothetical protein
VLRARTSPRGQPLPVSASDRRPRAGLQPPPPRADRTAALQRGRGCCPEAAPPPGPRRVAFGVDIRRRRSPRGRKGAPATRIGPSNALGQSSRGTPGRPLAGSEAPARGQPSPVSTLGGQSVQLAPRELGARLLPAGGVCCGPEPHPGGPRPPASDRRPPAALQPPPPRADRTAAPQRGWGCRAEAAPRPRRRPGAAPRPARGRCPPRRPPKTAKTGQNGPRNGSDRCPRETPGRPPARSEAPARGQLGPFSTLGG